MSVGEPLNWGLWRRWVVANAWSELLGLGGSAGVALYVFGVAGAVETATILLAAVGMVVTATILEGGVVGLAQWLVLRRVRPRLAGRGWIGATAFGAFLAWVLGMLPSTILSLQETSMDAGPPAFGAGAMMGLAFVMGLVLGPLLAFFQWLVLRRHLARAGWWIPANAVAWAVGMMLLFAGAGILSEGASPFAVFGVLTATCLLAGAVVGAIHGLVLIWLLREDGPAAPSKGSVTPT